MDFFAVFTTLVMEHSKIISTLPGDSPPVQQFKIPEKQDFPQLKDIKERVENATYPRIGQSWAAAENMADESAETCIARHALYFAGAQSFGLQWEKSIDGGEAGELKPASIQKAQEKRSRLLEKNPNMVMLSEIRYYDALAGTYPTSSAFWQHDKNGDCLINQQFKTYNRLDFHNADFQNHVAQQARAVMSSGAVDGVMLDWWAGKDKQEQQSKLEVLKKVRDAVGPDAIIIVNTNENAMPIEITKLINGYYMENYKTGTMSTAQEIKDEWKQIQETLNFSEKNAREPHVNMAEVWWERNSDVHREQLPRMRAITTLVMTESNGYALFADPNQNGVTNGHEHNWYQFWNAAVGKPLARGQKQNDGSYTRQFEHGIVVTNAAGDAPVTLKFPAAMKRCSDNNLIEADTETTVAAHDGEIFLMGTQPENMH